MMNERIQELIAETLDSEFRQTWDTMTYEDLLRFSEKFAELIVKECAQVANLTEDYDTDDYKSGRQWAAFDIKNHFVVEE